MNKSMNKQSGPKACGPTQDLPNQNLQSNNITRGLNCTLKFEKHWSTLPWLLTSVTLKHWFLEALGLVIINVPAWSVLNSYMWVCIYVFLYAETLSFLPPYPGTIQGFSSFLSALSYAQSMCQVWIYALKPKTTGNKKTVSCMCLCDRTANVKLNLRLLRRGIRWITLPLVSIKWNMKS